MDFLMKLLRTLLSIFSKKEEIIEDVKAEIPELAQETAVQENKNEDFMYDWSNLKPLNTSDPDLVQVDWIKYYKVEWPKDQVVLHHTVSGPGIQGDLNTWKDFTSHIATCMIVERDGKINQLFSSKYWGYHLGAGKASLDQRSIALELDNWGGLFLGDGNNKQFGKNADRTPRIIKTMQGKFYTVYGSVVDVPVTYYPDGFRGYYYYESYTYEQLRAIGELILLWNERFGIPLDYKEDMWDVSQKALSGEKGVWTHVSYRKPSDKQDCHPQPELIDLLKYLNKLV